MTNNKMTYWLVTLIVLALYSVGFGETMKSVDLTDVDSGLTSPAGNYRWMDSADQVYASSYQASYDYTQASVHIDYYTNATTLHGTLTASNMKPNFTYQLKLVGNSEVDWASNELIGLTGRWWQEEWGWDPVYGGVWMNGQNLNSKGSGASPNPNDNVYYSRRDIVDLSSPTGLHYRYTAYRVLDYFITDASGNASLDFEADSSYHVVFKTTQGSPSGQGPVKTIVFDVVLPDPVNAYNVDYPLQTVGIFGEWERLPLGGVLLDTETYQAEFLLTEESFHGSGLAGGWAAAMAGEAVFTICLFDLAGDLNDDCKVDFEDMAILTDQWLQPPSTPSADIAPSPDGDGIVNFQDSAIMAENWLIDCSTDTSNPACVPE
jgi:hypothetical protein